MSRYEELCARYTVWKREAFDTCHAFMVLPRIIVEQLQIYLDAPAEFTEFFDASNGLEKRKYVAPATATWVEATQTFTLKVQNLGFQDVELHKDGWFYFGIAVYLEAASNSYPKDPAWTLCKLRWESPTTMCLNIATCKTDFFLPYDEPASEGRILPICEKIVEIIIAGFDTPAYATFQ